MIAVAIIVPAAAFAWGPNRATFTVEQPAPYVTFDSITNNPNYGDERNFVTIKDAANTNEGGWTDEVSVQNGKEYYVRMYVHNNAADNLNLVAENVTAKFNVPSQEAKRIQIDGYITSSNANPTQVWDQAVFSSESNFKVDYVAGSAKYTNNVFTSGTSLPNTVVSSGAQLGYTSMDGKIPGCFKYDGFVTFKVKAVTSDFDVQKTVRVNGATDKTFKESVSVKPGDKVDYQIYFKNTGGTPLNDVVIKDMLPAGVTYDPGTSFLHNSSGTKQIADGITAGGAVIGGYLPGGDAYLKFTAQVAANDKLPVCGPNTLKNVAKATTSVGSKEDTAIVTVPKECIEVKNITVCELATKKIITINEKDFDAKKHSKNLADCKTEEPKKITVCELTTKKVITIDEKDFDAKKHSLNLNDCKTEEPKKVTVCELSTKKTITIDEKDFDAKKHSKNLNDCKTEVEKITVCELVTKKIITINKTDLDETKYSTDLSKCAEIPVTPPELPHTGAGDNIVAVVGLGAIVAGVAYYIASRRALGL
ncbi:MAG: exported protein of unknown function [Candidatus Saccharibacteria bacterium]|nr:exported protein of unknown function [Candidatus Saccharibacteria bacterium]